jgi:Histidine-specific methyltransferase, SAM-dependent/Bacterial regulatory proteins, tetR family
MILRTASGIFARRGYRGTTTREIAEHAGINEALLPCGTGASHALRCIWKACTSKPYGFRTWAAASTLKKERIHTENSYKFNTASIARLLRRRGFKLEKQWTDAQGWFCEAQARV